MKKRLLSGMVAFTMLAGMSTIVPSAAKLGDVLDDSVIGIEDAVAIINHVNGVKSLTDFQMKLADVNGDGVVDIQDAVTVINHINGVKPIDDVEITTDDEDTTEEEDTTTDEEDNKDKDEDDEPSDETPTDDEETTGEETEPGARTLQLFSDMADSNYYFSFTGDAMILDSVTDIDATINQVDVDTSIVTIKMTKRKMNSTIYNIGAKKYKIVDFDNKEYTGTLSSVEKMLDFNAIFVDLASNEEAMKFEGQEIDEETGYVVETYLTAISTPIVADVVVKAYYDKETDQLKKLILYTTDYDPEEEIGTVYINTESLEFTPTFELKEDLPDFSQWTKVKK